MHELGLNGLTTSKPKSTWVRLIRIDCELRGTSRTLSSQTLGKRESTQCLYEEIDEQSTKRGKVEATTTIANEISAGWIDTIARYNETPKLKLPRA